ncbi:TIGR00730 family Rossman fold protein [Massilia horti]|uniref:Cytokinin riboside 5'-monophosphate phosphoribohydrolase n=1 Tax=Massilia horti TaxID=2562153 RepID=A0A4Y9SXX3_9BURK|nr:TIGR00730 family Rossman fold protein [Massilia horti]TFW31584.1 TIGR00730 family Rossman fold protein [Massilia horti]TFW31623.1 TIGR00730 family Rossman fold protein [Massilia horti]
MKSIAVYCGASLGAKPLYAEGARLLARALVEHNIGLVYGGGKVGLMGVIADEVLRLGGEATGVIPRALLEREVGHEGLTRMFVVKDMHERKAMMSDLAEGFIAMPGGMGTLEELFEMVTWSQLGIHAKPIGLFNVNGFYEGLVSFVGHLQEEGFVRPQHAAMLHVERDPDVLVRRLVDAAVPVLDAGLRP